MDPLAEKRAEKMREMTLNDVFNDYIQVRESLKHNTLYNYKKVLGTGLAGWGDKAFLTITKDKVAKHHKKLGQERGEAYANLAMRLLRALFNFAAGHIIKPRKQMANVTKLSGIHFTVHDLRRTFITIAEGLDISAYALKRLMNHKMNGDITAGYIVTDVERLRKPMQQITDYFMKGMGIQPSATLLEIELQQGVKCEKWNQIS